MEQTIGSCLSKAKPWDRDFKQIKTEYKSKNLKNCLSFTFCVISSQYGAQLWGQANKESQNKIQVIQNRAPDFKKVVHFQNCLFMNQIKQNGKLAKSFSELKYCGYNHNYQTRSVTRKLFNIPYVKADAYGIQSAKCHCIINWNNFKKTFSNLSPAEHRNPKIKALLKKHFLNKY